MRRLVRRLWRKDCAPFSKTEKGRRRRDERLLKLRQREAALRSRDYDDGWFPWRAT